MPEIRTVKAGDLVASGRAYREVLKVERVPNPQAPTPARRQHLIDGLREDGLAEPAIAKALAKIDTLWVQLTVEGADGQPATRNPLPPDWPVEVERAVDDDDEEEEDDG